MASHTKARERFLGATAVALLALAVCGAQATAAEEPTAAAGAADTRGSFVLVAVTASGQAAAAQGTLVHKSGRSVDVKSGAAVKLDAGTYRLTAGVRTANGNLYKPVTRTVQIASGQEANPTLEVKLPPAVTATIVSRDAKTRGTFVRAFLDGREAFKFRPGVEVYLDEGVYEFRARPEPQNEIVVRESFSAGERKTVTLDVGVVPRVRIKVVTSGSGIWLRDYHELWQGGEAKYMIHPLDGARVRPGTYDLHLADKLMPWVKPGIVITEEAEQNFEIEVPVGHVTVTLVRADGKPIEGRDCLIGAGPDGPGSYRPTGRPVPLLPGVYNAAPADAESERQVFEVREGGDTQLTLRASD